MTETVLFVQTAKAEHSGLLCLNATAAVAYLDGLYSAIRLLTEYDMRWGTMANGYVRHIEHESEMFRANWESVNSIKLPR